MENKNIIDTELENVAGGAAYGNNYYTIMPGDTMSGIAAIYGTTVKKLLAMNPHIKDPNIIYAGDTIRIR